MVLVFLFYLVFTPVSTVLGNLAAKNNVNAYLIEGLTMLANFVLEYVYTRYFVYKDSCDTAEKTTEESKEESKEESAEKSE